MIIEKILLSELKLPEKNIRIHGDRQIQEFVRSVEMFGQIRPIVIDENNVILCGNGLYSALSAMGKTEAEVYRYTNLTESQKKKMMIADNKIFSLGVDDIKALDEFINELDDLDVPGFDEEALNAIVASAEETVEILNNYGVLNEDESQSIDTGAAIKEQRINEAVNNEQVTGSVPQTTNIGVNVPAPVEVSAVQQENASSKFIVCPHCGEKIWL